MLNNDGYTQSSRWNNGRGGAFRQRDHSKCLLIRWNCAWMFCSYKLSKVPVIFHTSVLCIFIQLIFNDVFHVVVATVENMCTIKSICSTSQSIFCQYWQLWRVQIHQICWWKQQIWVYITSKQGWAINSVTLHRLTWLWLLALCEGARWRASILLHAVQ